MKRVVVTGMSGITSLGETAEQIFEQFAQGKSGIRYMPDWEIYPDLRSKLAGPVESFTVPKHFNRKVTRGMGRVALMSAVCAEKALEDAGLLHADILKSGDTGVAFGSSAGSVDAVREFGSMLIEHNMSQLNATTYIRMMSHTSAVNMTVYFGLKGLTLPTSSACTSGSMAIGQAYEAIKYGKQTVMIAGGAEELSAAGSAVFDVLLATSVQNDHPEKTPRPFDANRDGLVVGEGAGCLILEEYEHAQARGATIYAEIIGYGSNTDGQHVTRPDSEMMGRCMQLALKDAQLTAADIDYVNAHGTSTDQGDIAESQATVRILGQKPISSLKSYFGHTLGACGAIEAWLSIEMMQRNQFVPTLNLDNIDPACAELDYICGDIRPMSAKIIMTNNFAFGGINTSLIFKNNIDHN
ncbi:MULTISPECIES: beta-ketoacyl-ACP synthase [Acinetobacter]|jgi:3-oxoacyl-[acyl-carrier-protein] synthase II|uniref:Beta-ketoacyl-ACP synthase II n=1 Tax=Acinetobacter towneri TaxID=202956 RepID=A0A1E8E2H8_9GAMM|nr:MULTISPECIES: beta-ketoacyl-ACP synthase [Acinetobacter]MBJ9954695.1 beta-ketoacyl-ACP synthase [Acinetobacter baumannii]MDH5819447.1 beta-ketoacyl-ACP synthase [Acinetobacter pseudolwoffii]MDM1325093.1 beta-ketoacyl-ACP synthase [Acinetobacter pseudolwoffii]OFE43810.1 beta-ketoacyl-ACP synthase II [Acinetobacter towneri]WPC33039.1 beta-ketoacyl-ACP synthase [Acinetobacter towneri]